jgi:putative ABC transport system permease protein
LTAQINLSRTGDGASVNAALRGVGRNAFKVRSEMRIVAGRVFEPGVRELIVGRNAQRQFQNIAIGDHIQTRGGSWTVVGVFASNGDLHESELLADAETLMSAEQRSEYQSVLAVLDSPATFGAFKDALTSMPTLAVEVMRETDYFARQSQRLTALLFVIAYIIGGIMALGAMFGALNAMYTAVSTRLKEIATLRAIGFGSGAVVASVLAEALLLAALGGIGGGSLAWLLFNGYTVNSSIGGAARGGQLIFDLTVSPQLLSLGIAWACAIGLVGGLFPAIRAARAPVASALRAG